MKTTIDYKQLYNAVFQEVKEQVSQAGSDALNAASADLVTRNLI